MCGVAINVSGAIKITLISYLDLRIFAAPIFGRVDVHVSVTSSMFQVLLLITKRPNSKRKKGKRQ